MALISGQESWIKYAHVGSTIAKKKFFLQKNVESEKTNVI
jgi:hypothetical protein